MPSEETRCVSPMGAKTRIGQRDSGHLADTLSARRSGTEPAISRRHGVGRGCGQTGGRRGVCVPALKPLLQLGRSTEERPRLQTGPGIAAMLVGILAGESPSSGTCPVATVVISGGGAGNQSVGSPEVKVPVGWVKTWSAPSGGRANRQVVAMANL